MFEFSRYLSKAKVADWVTAFYLLLLNLVIGLLPVWMTWFFLKLFGQNDLASSLIYKGEFAVYSASTLAAGLYLSSKSRISSSLRNFLKEGEFPKLGFPSGQTIFLISFPLLIASLILFFSTTITEVEDFPWKLDKNLYLIGLMILLFLTTILSFLIGVVDSALDPVYEEEFQNLVAKIKKQTDQDKEKTLDKLNQNFDDKFEELNKVKRNTDNDLTELQNKFDRLKSKSG